MAQTPLPGTPTGTTTSQGNNQANLPDWHKGLLWFLGAVTMIAIASPAPGIATWLMVIIISWVLLENWKTYKSFLGMK